MQIIFKMAQFWMPFNKSVARVWPGWDAEHRQNQETALALCARRVGWQTLSS
jgi:hypothetical protein